MLDTPELNVATYTVTKGLNMLQRSSNYTALYNKLTSIVDQLATAITTKKVTRFADAFRPADLTATLSKKYKLLNQLMGGSRKTLISEVMKGPSETGENTLHFLYAY